MTSEQITELIEAIDGVHRGLLVIAWQITICLGASLYVWLKHRRDEE